jgi:hypothetical protein
LKNVAAYIGARANGLREKLLNRLTNEPMIGTSDLDLPTLHFFGLEAFSHWLCARP